MDMHNASRIAGAFDHFPAWWTVAKDADCEQPPVAGGIARQKPGHQRAAPLRRKPYFVEYGQVKAAGVTG